MLSDESDSIVYLLAITVFVILLLIFVLTPVPIPAYCRLLRFTPAHADAQISTGDKIRRSY